MKADRLLALYERIADAPDAVPRLRRFILDLAVQGKLVQQAPDGEPASELLRRVLKEKVRLGIHHAYSPVSSNENPFVLPRGWVWTRIGEICSKTGSGSTPRGGKEAYKSSGVIFLRSQNIYDDGLKLDDVAYIDAETHARMSGTAVKPSDLLLNITGGSMGRCCQLPDVFGDANVSQHVAIIRPTFPRLADFLHLLIRSSYFQAFIFDEQTGAGRGGLPKNRMDRIVVALPPLAEQHHIVAKVNEMMALCDKLETAREQRETARDRFAAATLARLNAPTPETLHADARFALDALDALITRPDQIKQLRQAILSLAVRGKLVEQISTETVHHLTGKEERTHSSGKINIQLPDGWRWVYLSEVASARLGKMLDQAKNKGAPYLYLRNTNVHWFEVRTDDTKEVLLEAHEVEHYTLKNGDVLICEGGHGIGRTAVWRGESDKIVFQKALHRVRPGRHLDPDYFSMCCFAYFHEGVMKKYFTGVGIPHFTGRALDQLLFPLPPLAEQHRIVAMAGRLMSICNDLESALSARDDIRRRLLEAALVEAWAPAEVSEKQAAD